MFAEFEKVAKALPFAPAVTYKNKTTSYKELFILINSLAEHLKSTSFQSIGVVAKSDIHTIINILACLKARINVFILHEKLPQKEKIDFLKSLHIPLCLESLTKLNYTSKPSNRTTSSLGLLQEEPFIFLKTSGSSALPKIVALSLENFYFSAKGSETIMQLSHDSTHMLSLPLSHVAGLSQMFRALFYGSRMHLPHESYKSFPKEIKSQSITHISLVSTQALFYLENAPEFFSHPFKCLLLGGSHFPFPTLKRIGELSNNAYITYGLSEMASTVSVQQLTPDYKEGNLGHPLPYRHLKIEKNRSIFVSGNCLFKGYLNPKTYEITPPKSWFNTKDIGSYDPSMGLKVNGREDRMIISGGENIYPEEIERKILSIQGINFCSVIAKPSEKYGSRPVAFVSGNSYKDIIELLKSQLPSYKIPDEIIPWPKSIPIPEGKILKTTRVQLESFLNS